jgi:hypothetical protein
MYLMIIPMRISVFRRENNASFGNGLKYGDPDCVKAGTVMNCLKP